MTLPEALRAARGGRNQAEVAKAAGVRQPTISSWESDDPEASTLPAAHRLPRVAKAYRMPLATLRDLWLSASVSRSKAAA